MDKDMLEDVHARVLVELGPCDTLVNGAGGSQVCVSMSKGYPEMGDVEGDAVTSSDLEHEGVQKVLDSNFLGAFLTCQVFAKGIVGRDGCNILSISSASMKRPLTRIPIFSGTVVVLGNFTQRLVVHSVKAGIWVNVVASRFFVTRQNERPLYGEDGAPTTRVVKVLTATPMDWFGKPEELDGVLLFPLDNEAVGFITEVVLLVDGGLGANTGVRHACSVTYVLSYIP